jgi:arginyl-tRNA synthetase
MKTEEYRRYIADVCRQEFGEDLSVGLTRPQEQFGDYSTSVSMRLGASLKKKPLEIAEDLAGKLKHDDFAEVTVAGPGFINIKLKDQALFSQSKESSKVPKALKGKSIVAEYSDPNPFKALHAGHLYTSLVGDSIANILSAAGADVHRVNFGGDVGLHVAKTMRAIIQELGGENPEKLKLAKAGKLDWISARYVEGEQAYQKNEQTKKEIHELNKRVYKLHEQNDKASPFAQIYWTCRQWSYDGFDELYERLGMHPFDKYYPESGVADLGLKTIKEHTGKVYEKSDGAIVFKGEPYGLFTQVFVNSDGLSTYAGKDVGLIQQKFTDYHYDESFIFTDVSQKDHLAVVLKSVEQYQPEMAKKTTHLTHGRVKLAGGKKMSSREGNIVTADEVLQAAFDASEKKDEDVVLGAIRYSFLRNRIGGDIVYDAKESISLEGNSGPYLQYALVRARSILRKAPNFTPVSELGGLDRAERSLVRRLTIYPEAFETALREYSPHHLCSYLYELAASFNRFYEQSRVIDDPRADIRLSLVQSYEKVLSSGLELLGMPKPEKM